MDILIRVRELARTGGLEILDGEEWALLLVGSTPDRISARYRVKRDILALLVEGLGVGITSPPRKNWNVSKSRHPEGHGPKTDENDIDEERSWEIR